MKIAIIEDDSSYTEVLKEAVSEYSWDVDFFEDPSDFGKVKLDQYDVIISDYCLPIINGRELIKSISCKTSAQIFLMSAQNGSFHEEDIKNEKIKGLIDKSDPENVIDQIKYADTKIRINKLIEEERSKLEKVIPTNGYSLEEKGEFLEIKVTSPLSERKYRELSIKIEKSGKKNAVIYFPGVSTMASAYLNTVVSVYKIFKGIGGRIAFWNYSESELVKEQMDLCRLSSLIPVFNTLESASLYLHD